jgi:hypothetical protein
LVTRGVCNLKTDVIHASISDAHIRELSCVDGRPLSGDIIRVSRDLRHVICSVTVNHPHELADIIIKIITVGIKRAAPVKLKSITLKDMISALGCIGGVSVSER